MAFSGAIYTGFWTNWDAGRVLGKTLTVEYQTGAYLVAALAIYVRIVGARMWDIIRFILFRRLSSSRPEDGLYHQHQAALRNIEGNVQILKSCFDLWSAWRGKAESTVRRTAYIATPAVLNFVGFAIASIFASRITNVRSGSEVLLAYQQDKCGPSVFYTSESGTDDGWLDIETTNRAIESVAAALSEQCYNVPDQRRTHCPIFGRYLVPTTMSRDVACPFDNELCGPSGTVKFSSGMVDSLTHLGMNSEPQHRIMFQVETTCAVLNTTSRIREGPLDALGFSAPERFDTAFLNNSWFSVLDLGQSGFLPMNGTYAIPHISLHNKKFRFSNMSTIVGNLGAMYEPLYRIGTELAIVPENEGSNTFKPISGLQVPDSVVQLLILASNGQYEHPVIDPWFSATKLDEERGMYGPSAAMSVIGCTTQRQLCIPSKSSTEAPLCATIIPDFDGGPSLEAVSQDLTTKQQAILDRVAPRLVHIEFADSIRARGAHALLATRDSFDTQSLDLPDNQWIKELQHLFAIFMVQLQADFYLFTSDIAGVRPVRAPAKPEEQWMCSNQVVSSDAYASFSVLGLAIVLGVGLVVIIVSLFIEEASHLIEDLLNGPLYKSREWAMMTLFQIQKVAYSKQELGTWSGKKDIPTTLTAERFVVPDFEDEQPVAVAYGFPETIEGIDPKRTSTVGCEFEVDDGAMSLSTLDMDKFIPGHEPSL